MQIEELIIPASVKTIGNKAFAFSFTALKSVVYYGNSPDIISYTGNAFEGCFKLTTLKVPNDLNIDDEKWKSFLGWSFQTVTRWWFVILH